MGRQPRDTAADRPIRIGRLDRVAQCAGQGVPWKDDDIAVRQAVDDDRRTRRSRGLGLGGREAGERQHGGESRQVPRQLERKFHCVSFLEPVRSRGDARGGDTTDGALQDRITNVMSAAPEEIVAATRQWLEKAVIGLNLCPFAKPVHARDQIRYVVTEAETPEELLADLIDELQALAAAEPEEVETTLLIHPRVLNDFLDYNDFLGVAEETVADLGLEGGPHAPPL